MKKVFFFILFLLVFCVSANAADEDVYIEEFRQSGVADIYDSLPDDTREALEKLEISPEINSSVESINTEKVFSLIIDFIKNGGAKTAAACGGMIFVIIVSAMFGDFGSKKEGREYALNYLSVTAVAGLVLIPVFTTVTAATAAIQDCSRFMLSFVPVFAGILLSGGRTAAATAYGSTMLGAAEVISSAASFLVLPISGMYLAVSITGAVSDRLNMRSFANALKRIGIWIISFGSMIFIGIIRIQSLITASTDTIGVSAAKFAVGTAVPIIGAAIGEAITTVKGCMNILSASAAVWGVAALAVIFLPIIIELAFWRIGINVSSAVADIFSGKQLAELLRAIDTALAFLIAVVFCVALIFIVSLTIVSGTGSGSI